MLANSIPERESLTVEFKSDVKRLPDRDLIMAVACLANTDGGKIYLGVEDDGTVTGLHPEHQSLTGLAVLIANRTVPSLTVRVTALRVQDRSIAIIEVPRSNRPVATSEGLLQRRRLLADGSPECVPFFPHEWDRRASDFGQLDISALPVQDATLADFNPLERERLRQMIERLGGDQSLLRLSDDELDGALGLIRRSEGATAPTVAGLLLLGKENALREYLPTHEVAFQVLNGTQVRVNDFYRMPLLYTYERVMEQFEARIEEDEILISGFRVPIPTYDRSAFREALANALIHRDYTRLGAVHVRWQQDTIEISNPGRFVEGVSLENLLVTEPLPRNPVLADAFKRIGLVERTGRGVDIIFKGFLRYGRPLPDYSRSSTINVIVSLPAGEADKQFLRLIIEEEKRLGTPLSVETLMALHALRDHRRIDAVLLGTLIQKGEAAAQQVLAQLLAAGLVEAHETHYTFSAEAARRLGYGAVKTRKKSSKPLPHEQEIVKYLQAHGRITRREAIELCRIRPEKATWLLGQLVKAGKLRKMGSGRNVFYVRGKNLKRNVAL
jgi:ATP-dependent DNA helicase RecG